MAKEYRLGPFKRSVNVMLRRMFTRGKGPADGYVVTTRGRKSGTEYNTPIRIVENASGRFLVSPYGERNWTKNARAAGTVGLTRGNRTENVRIREVSPEEGFEQLLAAHLRGPRRRGDVGDHIGSHATVYRC